MCVGALVVGSAVSASCSFAVASSVEAAGNVPTSWKRRLSMVASGGGLLVGVLITFAGLSGG
jgi:hypothetical protein